MDFRILIALLLFGIGGCSSMLVEESPPALFYELEYLPETVDCRKSFDEAVRIWKFDEASPFDRPEMVAVGPGRTVEFSPRFQWVSSPGTLVSEILLRDLTAGKLFPRAVGPESPGSPPLDLTGRIFRFAWERGDKSPRALMQAQVSLTRGVGEREVIFQRSYTVVSEAMKGDSSAAFAAAMSAVVRDFSRRLRQDLCESLE